MPKQIIEVSPPNNKGILNIEASKEGSKDLIKIPINLENKLLIQLNKNNCNENPNWNSLIQFCFSKKDILGKWSWGVDRNWEKTEKFNALINDCNNTYHNKKTWHEVMQERCMSKGKRTEKHHYYKINKIQKEARDRLIDIGLEDFEKVFRFRLENKFRFYGVVIGNTFLALWHDPEHGIYKGKD